MDIKLNLIDHSSDANNSDVLIYQKNCATDFDNLAVAWRVIKNLGQGNYHPFVYPMDMYVSGSDSYGNYTPELLAQNGQLFHMIRNDTGDVLTYSGDATSPKEVQVANDMKRGAMNASIYKDGKVLATKTSIAPGQKAVFQFKPVIYIGVVSQIVEGQVLNSGIMTKVNTEISLLGLASADIIMTGGGPGKESTEFRFALENVKMA